MLQNLTGWHALIILAVVVLIFGAAKLPALAQSVGQSMRILKNETRDETAEQDDAGRASTQPERSARDEAHRTGANIAAVPPTASESVGA